METIKLVEAHASEPGHLAEILELMFPNGFKKRQQAAETLETAITEFKKGNYGSSPHSQGDVEELLEKVKKENPAKVIDEAEKYAEEETNRNLRPRFEEVAELMEPVKDDLAEIEQWLAKNKAMPKKFREPFQGETNNYSYTVQVLTPISRDMPTGPVPSFFEPFAIPIDDFKKYDLEESLKIIHSGNPEGYQKMYERIVKVGDTSWADIKNIDDLNDYDFINTMQFSHGKAVEVTKPEDESSSLKALKRRWSDMFGGDGVVCSSGFEHELRPKLKKALLSDKPEVIVLYTGFLNGSTLKKFVITYFLETYRDIIENLTGRDLERLDRKFVVSLIESQDIIKDSSGDIKLGNADIQFKKFLRDSMNKARHFNTDFWFDFKPDEANSMILAKSDIHIITRMKPGEAQSLLSDYPKTVRDKIKEDAFNNRLYQENYGFVMLKEASVPEWKRNGVKTYGHRLPCPRMTMEDAPDDLSRNDFSYFTEALGYEEAGAVIEFSEYMDDLLEDYRESEKPYADKKKQDKAEEEKKEQEQEKKMSDMRKATACSLLKSYVAENKIPTEEKGNSWTKVLENEVKPQMVADDMIPEEFSTKQLMKYTEDVREDLEEKAEQEKLEGLDVPGIADELKQMEEFAYGSSKDGKKVTAKYYIMEEYGVPEERAEDAADEATELAIAKLGDILNQSLVPDMDREEFRELMGLNVEEDSEAEEQPSSDSNNETVEDTSEDEEAEDSEDETSDDISYVEVRITSEVPEFKGTDLEVYGPFEEGEVVEVPEDNADILCDRGNATRDLEADTEEVDVEPPGEEWLCECGRLNEEDRTVCGNPSCTKRYDEVEDSS